MSGNRNKNIIPFPSGENGRTFQARRSKAKRFSKPLAFKKNKRFPADLNSVRKFGFAIIFLGKIKYGSKWRKITPTTKSDR